MIGGTGFIGRALCAALFHGGHRVTVLTRRTGQLPHQPDVQVESVQWNARDTGPWEQLLEEADAVINLAGAPIADARWTDARKQLLTDSRVRTTRLLIGVLSRRSSKAPVLISASGIGYYGASDDRLLDEGAARGTGFLERSRPTACLRHHRFQSNAIIRHHTRDETSREIFAVIEGFYNRQRLHQSLAYLSPPEFERRISDS